MKHFKFYSKQDVLYLTRIRRFETKLGEMIQVADDLNNLEKSLNDTISKYVLIGIPEDIGERPVKYKKATLKIKEIYNNLVISITIIRRSIDSDICIIYLSLRTLYACQ